MSGLKLTNFGTSTLASGINASVTTLSVQAGDASLFPALGGGEWFPVVVVSAAGVREIMRCTARTAAVLTVTRGQEGTSAVAFSAGARVDCRLTKAAIDDMLADKAALAGPAFTGVPTAPTAAGGTNTTQIATTGFVAAAVAAILNGVSAAFDTLAEIATDLGLKLVKSANLSDVASALTAFNNIKQAATTVLAGVVALATNAEADTGTDAAKAITPAALRFTRIESFIVAVGDELTAITTGVAVVTFRMPYAFTLTDIRGALTAASTSGIPTFDVKENGTTIFSTKLTIDANEKTSVTAAVPKVISDANLADDAEMTINIDVAGTGAKGAKLTFIGRRA